MKTFALALIVLSAILCFSLADCGESSPAYTVFYTGPYVSNPVTLP